MDARVERSLPLAWKTARERHARAVLGFTDADTTLAITRDQRPRAVLVGMLAVARRRLAEVRIALRHAERELTMARYDLIDAIEQSDASYGTATTETRRKAIIDRYVTDTRLPDGHPLSGSDAHEEYVRRLTDVADLTDDRDRCSTEIDVLRDELRIHVLLVGHDTRSDVESGDSSAENTEDA